MGLDMDVWRQNFIEKDCYNVRNLFYQREMELRWNQGAI